MKILITSGGTTEYIDDVRVLTNISTGKLGASIANWLKDHEIIYLHGRNAELPPFWRMGHTYISVKDTAELMEQMEKLVPEVDVVIHAMAVSDFTFNRENPVKLKSNDADGFIEYMRANIKKTPKIISLIKKWNPNVFLVGFKFEVGVSHKELTALGLASIEKNGCDVMVINDKEEMIREKSHIAYVMDSVYQFRQSNKGLIAQTLEAIIEFRFIKKRSYFEHRINGVPECFRDEHIIEKIMENS